ncbi:Isopenicillin N epimerase component 2 [Arthroderma sp. PD_2]|nr:Isopenicillin N epimerase component 2 [Arthroderma sp. PD_2]
MTAPLTPLQGIRVVELSGLAPGPFAGLMLSDYGASVVRIDRPHPRAHSQSKAPPPPTVDALTRHKTSISLDLKAPASKAVLLSLLSKADVLIDPYRPGVLEKLGLCPTTLLLKHNPRLIVARMTGFRRDGKYKDMAGHDINYIAVSGALSLLGREGEKPYPPGNILGDFAGGGAVCFQGILLALLARQTTGKGQVVNANMVDGSAYLATFPRLARQTPMWDRPRGTNVLDGGCPYYDTYETKDKGNYFAVGALEPQFYAALLRGLGLEEKDVFPSGSNEARQDPENWPYMRAVFEKKFKEKTRNEWAAIFDGTDACATPVLTMEELEKEGYDQRPVVGLSDTPGLDIAADDGGWSGGGIHPGSGGEETLKNWLGWQRGKDFDVHHGALVRVKVAGAKL